MHSAYSDPRHNARHERTTRSDKYAHIRGATTRTAGSGHAAERHTPDTSLPHTHSVRAEAWASESSNHTAPLRVVTSEDLKHAATHTIHTHGKLTHHTIRRNTMRTFIGLDRVGCGSSPRASQRCAAKSALRCQTTACHKATRAVRRVRFTSTSCLSPSCPLCPSCPSCLSFHPPCCCPHPCHSPGQYYPPPPHPPPRSALWKAPPPSGLP